MLINTDLAVRAAQEAAAVARARVVRLGREVGVPTPMQEFIYCCLLPQEMKARGQV
jgi:hypothetical protein